MSMMCGTRRMPLNNSTNPRIRLFVSITLLVDCRRNHVDSALPFDFDAASRLRSFFSIAFPRTIPR